MFICTGIRPYSTYFVTENFDYTLVDLASGTQHMETLAIERALYKILNTRDRNAKSYLPVLLTTK